MLKIISKIQVYLIIYIVFFILFKFAADTMFEENVEQWISGNKYLSTGQQQDSSVVNEGVNHPPFIQI